MKPQARRVEPVTRVVDSVSLAETFLVTCPSLLLFPLSLEALVQLDIHWHD